MPFTNFMRNPAALLKKLRPMKQTQKQKPKAKAKGSRGRLGKRR